MYRHGFGPGGRYGKRRASRDWLEIDKFENTRMVIASLFPLALPEDPS